MRRNCPIVPTPAVFLWLTCLFASNAYAALMSEQQKIDAMLNAIGNSHITFIRGKEEHDGPWTKQFFQTQLHNANPKITTAKEFITKLATTDEKTGKPYRARYENGTKVTSAKMFTDFLLLMEENDREENAKTAAPTESRKSFARKHFTAPTN